MRWLLGVALVAIACGPRSEAPASASPTGTAALTAPPTATPTESPTGAPANAAAGGIEVWATGPLHGTYVWVVRLDAAPQDRVTETLYVVAEGSAPRLVLRRLRDARDIPMVLFRELSADGTKLVLENAYLGPAAQDGFIVVDLANGRIEGLARGDRRSDVMPAWSPDGKRIAYARRNPGVTPVAVDDGLWVINTDGTGGRQLLPPNTMGVTTYVFGWTADATGIAFGSAFEGVGYSVADAATGAVSGPGGVVFGLAPASWRLKTPQFAGAFSAGDKGGEPRIDLADGIGKPARTIAREPAGVGTDPAYLDARWSPIGDEVLFIRTARGGTKVSRVGLAGGSPTDVALEGQPFRAEWLPDGRIAYIVNAGGGSVRITNGLTSPVVWAPENATFADLAIRTYP